MENKTCINCGSKDNYSIKEEILDNFKGEYVGVTIKVPSCNKCGGFVYIEEIEDENIKKTYEKYKGKTKIVSPDELSLIMYSNSRMK